VKTFSFPDHFARIRHTFELFDDFANYGSGESHWTNLAADGGVTGFAEGDARNGRIQGATGATDNNEIMCRSTNELAIFVADFSFIFEVGLQYSEAATNAANVAIGLADAAAANLLSDDGGGDNINSSGVLLFKVDGGTIWRAACENNAVIVETASVQTAGTASAYQRLRIEGKAVDGTNMRFAYFLDGNALTDSNNRPISHLLAFASATEMRLVAGYIKAGGATTETLNLDYVAYAATRT
jgi:hypothetical protein